MLDYSKFRRVDIAAGSQRKFKFTGALGKDYIVRAALDQDGMIWLAVTDISEVSLRFLGSTRRVVELLDGQHIGVIKMAGKHKQGKSREILGISAAGLSKLTMGFNKPTVKLLWQWYVNVVAPAMLELRAAEKLDAQDAERNKPDEAAKPDAASNSEKLDAQDAERITQEAD